MLSVLAPIHLHVDDYRETPAAFGNALVDLSGGSLHIRIRRERDQIFVAFGSTIDSATLFDSAILMDFLGLTETAGFHSPDSTRMLAGIASFIRANFYELEALFSPSQYVETKQKLMTLQQHRMVNRWGNRNG